MKRNDRLVRFTPPVGDAEGSAKGEVDGPRGSTLPMSLCSRPLPQASDLRAMGITGTDAFFASLTPMVLNSFGSKAAVRVLCGKMTMEIPFASRSAPPSRTDFRSSRGLVRPR